MTHNVSANYHNASGAGDYQMKRDILLSELSKMVVNRPQRVMQLINTHKGGKSIKQVNQGQLIKMVSDGLQKSPRFAKAIALEILGVESNFSADSKPLVKTTDPAKSTDWSKILGDASSIVNGLGNLFGGKNLANKAKSEADKAKAEAEKALAEKANTVATLNGAKSNITTYVLIGLGVVVVIGGVVAYVKFIK